MLRFVATRLASLVPILVGVSLFAFLLVHLVPGDPIQAMLGMEATEEAIQTLRVKYGLDRSVPEQYVIWLGNVVRGDLGRSIQSRRPVLELITRALVPTAYLALTAVVLSLLIAIPAGVVSATRRGTWADHLATMGALSGLSLPSFWLGILLILLFSVQLGWLPSSGYVSPLVDPLRAARHLALPTITLGVALAAATMRMTRGAVLETMQQDYVRTARAKGLSERVVTRKHVFRNALMPVVTLVGIQIGQLLGGVVVTETVFAWPGLGKLTVDAIFARDYPIVQASVLTMGVLFVLINLLTDLTYTLLDPRVRY